MPRPIDPNRPTCRNCGCDLLKHSRRIETKRVEDMPKVGDDTQLGPVMAYTRRPHPAEGGGWQAFVWTGRYGYDGTNAFCSQRCASQYATRRIKT